MSTKAPPNEATLDAAKAVMKRMLQTPPTPHEVKGDGKAKTRRKAKREK